MTRRFCTLLLLAVTVACQVAPPEPPADAIAFWEGGALTLEELETRWPHAGGSLCAQAKTRGQMDDIIPCYREIAEELALERSLRLVGSEPSHQLDRRILLETFRQIVGKSLEIDERDVEKRYAEDPASRRRPGRVLLWDLLLRHDDPAHPEETFHRLEELKGRAEAGERFEDLARQYSQSETRLRGGSVGPIREGRLPERLDEVVFALDDGEVSDPVPVRDGAVLLMVRQPSAPKEYSLDEARESILHLIRAERVEEVLRARAAEIDLPAGASVFDGRALWALLDDGEQETVVLSVGAERLTVGEFRTRFRLPPSLRLRELDPDRQQRLLESYEQLVRSELLFLDLSSSLAPEANEARERSAELRRIRALEAAVRDRFLREIDEKLIEAEILREFEHNPHHYQTPLRFHLVLWSIPFDHDPPSQARSLERARVSLMKGETTLDDAILAFGGATRDFGLRDFEDLPELPPKARTAILSIPEGRFVPPYQQDESFHILHVVERFEPRLLTYQEAARQVREDYLARNEATLLRAAIERQLEEMSFAFDEEKLRQALAPLTSG